MKGQSGTCSSGTLGTKARCCPAPTQTLLYAELLPPHGSLCPSGPASTRTPLRPCRTSRAEIRPLSLRVSCVAARLTGTWGAPGAPPPPIRATAEGQEVLMTFVQMA